MKHPEPPGRLIYNPGSIWRMYLSGNNYYAAINYINGEIKQTQALLQTNPEWNRMRLKEKRREGSWQSLLNVGAGELLFRTSILFSQGIVFHASGIDDNGKGIVFVGHSGAGKSTQAGIWSNNAGATVMNDDRIAVRFSGNQVFCYGTPWGGEKDIAKNHKVSLSAIIVLEQSKETSILSLAPPIASPLLLARSFLPYWDGTLIEKAVTNLNAIVSHTPIYLLRCRPEPDIIPLVRSVL